MDESTKWRKDIGDEVRECNSKIKCLADHFIKYKPQLEEGLVRRKWWAQFWEERRQELITYSVRGGALTLCGLVVYAVSSKAIAWIKSVVSNVA